MHLSNKLLDQKSKHEHRKSFLLIVMLPYSFLAAALEVTSVTPSTVLINTSEMITLTGSGFSSVIDVYFGSVKSPSFTIRSDSEITAACPIPKGPSQIVHVTVDTGLQRSPIAYSNRFVFQNGIWLAYLGYSTSLSQDCYLPRPFRIGLESIILVYRRIGLQFGHLS